jgi:hypothetical protein
LFVDFVLQHAKPINHIILSSVVCYTRPCNLHYFKYGSFSNKNRENVHLDFVTYIFYKHFLL